MKSFGLPRLKFEPRPDPTHTFLGKGYQDNPYLHLSILDITKTSSNNCL